MSFQQFQNPPALQVFLEEQSVWDQRDGIASAWEEFPPKSPAFPQDGILLGAVGAYDWNGAVLKETSSGKVIPLRESYLQEFPEELKNHGAYLGGRAEREAVNLGEFGVLSLKKGEARGIPHGRAVGCSTGASSPGKSPAPTPERGTNGI